jgi:hypothetical protein
MLIVFIAFIAYSNAGFCDNRMDGWYCDFNVAKYCSNHDKVQELYCTYKCDFGHCRLPYYCEQQKTPTIQDLSWCRGIVVYSVDAQTNFAAGDQNAKSYSELLASYKAQALGKISDFSVARRKLTFSSTKRYNGYRTNFTTRY